MWTLLYLNAFNSFVKKALTALFNRTIRWHMLFFAIIVYYQTFYNFWAVWNYLNDEPLQYDFQLIV